MNDRSRCSSRTSAHGIAKYVHHVAKMRPMPGDRDGPGRDRPPGRAVDDGVDRGDRADDPLAERDDHQEPVPLRDVMCVPGRPAAPPLGDERSGYLDGDQHERDGEGRLDRQVDDREHDPEDLRHGDRPDVDGRRGPTGWVVTRNLRPQEDHRHAHHDVAGDHDAVVERVALRRSMRTPARGRARARSRPPSGPSSRGGTPSRRCRTPTRTTSS